LEATAHSYVSLEDAGVLLSAGPAADASWVLWAVRSARAIAANAVAARRHIPVAPRLAVYLDGWRSLAADQGLQAMQTPLCMWRQDAAMGLTMHLTRLGSVSQFG